MPTIKTITNLVNVSSGSISAILIGKFMIINIDIVASSTNSSYNTWMNIGSIPPASLNNKKPLFATMATLTNMVNSTHPCCIGQVYLDSTTNNVTIRLSGAISASDKIRGSIIVSLTDAN